MIEKLRRRHHRNTEPHDLLDAIQRFQMRPGQRQGIQRREPRRLLAILDAEITANTPAELRYRSLPRYQSAIDDFSCRGASFDSMELASGSMVCKDDRPQIITATM
jgi:hypothetical protein